MKVIIDRFEGDYAVVELPDQSFIDVPKSLFPGAKENDVIDISIDKKSTDERKQRIQDLMDSLFND